jgi:L-amino acid N-acyltransferase YncA
MISPILAARMQDMTSTNVIRPAHKTDAAMIASIYNEALAGREATFETELRQPSAFQAQIDSERYPLLVAGLDGQVSGWAGLAPYSERAAYAGIAEFSIYVAQRARGQRIGTVLCQQLVEEANRSGLWKLIGKIFPENLACARMTSRCGFREVGLHRRHGRLDNRWRDVLLVERLLSEAHEAAVAEK